MNAVEIDTASVGHPLLALSAAGLRYAVRLRPLPVSELTRRIYAYHTLPLSLRIHAQLPTWLHVQDWIGFGRSLSWPRKLHRSFVQSADPAGYWTHWRRPTAVGALAHKLYISPRPDAVPQLFPRLVETFEALDVQAFKIGASSRVLLRPDKLVAYFASRDHLRAVADELAPMVTCLPPHGVPFTAPLCSSSALSWGYDPGIGGSSWRLWIAHVLALGISGAPAGPADQVLQHVRSAIVLAGIDPDCWEPRAGAAT